MTTKLIRTGAFAAALMAMPIAAQAADLPPPYAPPYKAAPSYAPPVPVFSWTGFYVGINAGYAWGSADWSGGAGNFSTDPDGYLVGGTFGYNLQTGNWVWGIEADIAYADVNSSGDASNCATCNFDMDWFGTVRGRIGYAGWGNWMPYFTGGGAFGGVKTSTAAGNSGDTLMGWTLGAGVEYAFAGNWSAKLEYLYVDLGTASCAAATCGTATDINVDYTTNIVRAGINYRF